MQQNQHSSQSQKLNISLQLYQSKRVTNLNIIAGLHRAFTILLCVLYYTYVEQIPMELRLSQNDGALIGFTLVAQYLSCFQIQLGPTYWRKLGSELRLEFYRRIGYVILGYSNVFLVGVVCIVWPVLCWFNFKVTQLDTDYFALRYMFNLAYIALQMIPYRAIDNMQMFFGDGILLTQIFSMLSYNRMSLSLIVFVSVPLILLQNCKLCIDVILYEKEEFQKSSFVRLIGQHDSTYFIIVFSMLVSVLNILDAIAVDPIYATNLLYVPFVLYMFTAIMDTKHSKLVNSFFPTIVVIGSFAAIAFYLIVHISVKINQQQVVHTEPLWKPAEVTPYVESENEKISLFQAVWRRFNLRGFWIWLEYIVIPFWNWAVYPFLRFTVFPVMDWLSGMLRSVVGAEQVAQGADIAHGSDMDMRVIDAMIDFIGPATQDAAQAAGDL